MERRRHPRSPSGEVSPLEVSVSSPSLTGRLVCELLNLSVGGALVRIPPSETGLPLGTAMTLEIDDPDTGTGLTLAATLRHRHVLARSERLGLAFDDPVAAEALLTPVLVQRFDRRVDVRVAPAADAGPVWVTLEVPGQSPPVLAQGQLRDVSIGGLGVSVPGAFEIAAGGRDRVECTMFLPGTPQPVALPARIVHRTLEGDEVQYGVRFDDADPRVLEVIVAYVLRRQRELVRELAAGATLPPLWAQG